MWEIRETSNVPGGYTFDKCTLLQLLMDRVRELELDALRIIQGAENIIDKGYREVVTPKIQAAGSWVTPRRDNGGASSGSQVSGTMTGSEAQRERVQSNRMRPKGDSVMRQTNRRFCGHSRDTKMVCCLPGTRNKDVSEWLKNMLKEEDGQPEVIMHIGTNDL
eukprot:g37644.t1